MIKITYKHWTKDKVLEVVGIMPPELNNGSSDRLIVQKPQGDYEDVIKNTVIMIEEVDTD